MIRFIVLFAFTIGFLPRASCQDREMSLVSQGAHCLATDSRNWLAIGDSQNVALELGYVIDAKSDPGASHLYIVKYDDMKRSGGLIFDLNFTHDGNKVIFDVQNNGKFVRSHKGVQFTEPPLGGTWTQTQLMSAIMRAGRGLARTIELNHLLVAMPNVGCKSYANHK